MLPYTIFNSLNQWLFKDSTNSTSPGNLEFSYIVKYSGRVNKSDHLPLLIALHGDGDTVDNFYQTALNNIHVPARIIIVKGPISHECGYVWPWSIAQFEQYGHAFGETVASLTANYPTINKPILLGFSGGGGMAYYQAIKQGNNYSTIFAISSLLAKEKLGNRSSRPSAKVYAYHGRNDTVIPFTEGKKTVQLLKKKKVNVSFTEFEGGHHGLFSEMKTTITQTIEKKLTELSHS